MRSILIKYKILISDISKIRKEKTFLEGDDYQHYEFAILVMLYIGVYNLRKII